VPDLGFGREVRTIKAPPIDGTSGTDDDFHQYWTRVTACFLLFFLATAADSEARKSALSTLRKQVDELLDHVSESYKRFEVLISIFVPILALFVCGKAAFCVG
jgi:hypothetical protein